MRKHLTSGTRYAISKRNPALETGLVSVRDAEAVCRKPAEVQLRLLEKLRDDPALDTLANALNAEQLPSNNP